MYMETKEKRLRWDITKMSSAEKSIQRAMEEVELIWADVKLTKVVTKLLEAQTLIYDYYENT